MLITENETGTMIEIKALGSRDATVARASAIVHGSKYDAEGTSKRDPQDEDNVEVGDLIALGRALESLGKKLQKRAAGLTKHQDDIKQYKQAQKAKAEKKVAKPKVNAARKAKVAAKN